MSNWLADTIDNVGTYFNLPDWGISENQAGGATSNTGRVPYSGVTNTAKGQAIGNLVNTRYDANQAVNNILNGMNFDTGSGQAQTGPPTTSTTYNTPNYAVQNAGAISLLNQSGNTVQNALNRLPGQLDIALGNIGTQYNQRNNELQSGFDQSQNQYNQSTTQNSQNLRSNKNTINDQASSGLRGLQRLLGARGAVGSDMGLAGQAVSDVVSAQNAGAGQTFAQNQQNLDQNWGNYGNQFENERRELGDWRSQQESSARAQSATTRQDLLSKLADIQGQIGAARGGSYASSAQPYLDQANALSGQIDALGRLNPTYTGSTPTYEAAPLSSYSTGNGATIASNAAGGGGLNTPLAQYASWKRQKKTALGF